MAYFVPNGDSREETAVLLVGTAREYGINVREIKVRSGGFEIPDELADVLYNDVSSDTEKTSGNRAAKTKKNSKKEE